MSRQVQPRLLLQDGDEHGHASVVDPQRRAPRHRQARGRHQRLYLDQERPSPLEARRDNRSRSGGGAFRKIRKEDLAWIRHLFEAARLHCENTDLVRATEAVLHPSEDPGRVPRISLEGEHGVDEVLERSRAGNRPVLRHVAHQEHRHFEGLRQRQDPRGRLAHLGDRPRRRTKFRDVKRLDRVDHGHARADLAQRPKHCFHLRGSKHEDRLAPQSEPLGAHARLLGRLLARHVKDTVSLGREAMERLERER